MKIEQRVEPDLEQTLSPQLTVEIELLMQMQAQLDELSSAYELQRQEIQAMMREAGITKIEDFMGHNFTDRTGELSSKLNKTALMATFGISKEQWDSFVVKKPKKSFLDVRAVGKKREGEEDE